MLIVIAGADAHADPNPAANPTPTADPNPAADPSATANPSPSSSPKPSVTANADQEADPRDTLTLEPMFTSRFTGLTNVETREGTHYLLGSVRADVESVARENVDTPYRLALDVPSRSWEVSLRLSRNLGFARLDVGATLGEAQSRLLGDAAYDPNADAGGLGTGRRPSMRARYYEVGAALTRTKRLSRWMTGWISLSVSARKWLGDQPPPGEANGAQVMLNIGTTFK